MKTTTKRETEQAAQDLVAAIKADGCYVGAGSVEKYLAAFRLSVWPEVRARAIALAG
jgi:hypothetical protein